MTDAKANLKEREQAVENLVKPLQDKIETLEKARIDSAAALRQHIETLVKPNNALSEQTHSLSSALTHRPQVRGQWGEMQVERALELSGLTKGIHYETQKADNQGQRPDFIIHIPHNPNIILDSKVSLNAYMEGAKAKSDEDRNNCLERHAQAMKKHNSNLASKNYQNNLPSSVDFVVMVVPGFVLSPAIERDSGLLERARSGSDCCLLYFGCFAAVCGDGVAGADCCR